MKKIMICLILSLLVVNGGLSICVVFAESVNRNDVSMGENEGEWLGEEEDYGDEDEGDGGGEDDGGSEGDDGGGDGVGGGGGNGGAGDESDGGGDDGEGGVNSGNEEGGEAGDEGDEMGGESPEDNLMPKIYIKAINPGYKIDGINNVGEMIEIGRIDSDAPISLAGTAVGYTNSSGNRSILFEFPENSWMTGESILLRLASSPESELATVNYTKTLAMSAQLDLVVDGEIIDQVCWTGKQGCYKAFSSAKPTVLARDLETGEFEHMMGYLPKYDEGSYRVDEMGDGQGVETESESEIVKNKQCYDLRLSEVLSFYDTAKSEQFVEFYNAGTESVEMDGCKIRYKNKKYALSGTVVADGYFAYYPVGFSLTKNPVNSNKLEIIDADNSIVDAMEYPNGQKRGTAYALIGNDKNGEEIWKTTYVPTPGAPNNYQEFKTCEIGKVINKTTGNCVKVTSVAEKVCKEGYYLNILTGRCNKKKTTETKTCKEGYYWNPETNRCRKIQENKGADYSVEPENYEENSSFIALYAVLGIVGVSVMYLVYEFRHEIRKLWRRVFRRAR